jgi:pimeloyl-ACP methyl ester carboxylesterase
MTFANLLWAEKKIDIPTLLIVGKEDGIISYKTAISTYKKYVGNSYVLFEKSGHVPCIEEVDKYCHEVLKFIEYQSNNFVLDTSKNTSLIVNNFLKKSF